MRAKICGITTLEDGLFAAQAGAWALGFNFYSPSPRYIEPEKARRIISQLPKQVLKVGIFIGHTVDFIRKTLDAVGLDLAQVYEDLEAPSTLKERRMIFEVQAATSADLPMAPILQQYAYILLDASKGSDGIIGGTGRLGNWELAADMAKNYQLILAGGLTLSNVALAHTLVNPYAMDVASGVENAPGIKDPHLVERFIKGYYYDH